MIIKLGNQLLNNDNQQPTTSKSAKHLDNCFIGEETSGDNLDDTEYDVNMSGNIFSKIEQSCSSNNSSINQVDSKRSKKNSTSLKKECDDNSDSEYKPYNSKSSSIVNSFKIEPNQNANMGFINSNEDSTSIKASKLSFSNLKLPTKSEFNHQNSMPFGKISFIYNN